MSDYINDTIYHFDIIIQYSPHWKPLLLHLVIEPGDFILRQYQNVAVPYYNEIYSAATLPHTP